VVRAAASAVSRGTVPSVPSTPKAMSTGRRPTRSEIAPTSGWTSMNTTSVSAEISAAAALLKPAVLTRNFCA
jgi:hypothetical protein